MKFLLSFIPLFSETFVQKKPTGKNEYQAYILSFHEARINRFHLDLFLFDMSYMHDIVNAIFFSSLR